MHGMCCATQARSQRELVAHPGPAQYAHLGGDVSAALERHREQRQLRSSRPQSPEHGAPATREQQAGVGLGSGGGAAGSPPGDPRVSCWCRVGAGGMGSRLGTAWVAYGCGSVDGVGWTEVSGCVSCLLAGSVTACAVVPAPGWK